MVAKDLGEDEDWLWDIAIETEIEDGVIWVYGVEEDSVQTFTDFGIENLIELITFYKENPGLLKWWSCGLRRLSITHISSSCDFGAKFDICESREAAPDDNISRRRIARPGQVAPQSCKFGKIKCKGSRATSSMARAADESIEQCDLGVRQCEVR